MRLSVLGTLLALGLVAGCAGGSEPEATPTGTPTATSSAPVIVDRAAADDAVAVTKEYLAAFIAGRSARVCALETPAFVTRQIAAAVASKLVAKGVGCVGFVDRVVATARKANPSPGGAAGYEVTALAADQHKATVRVDYPQSGGTSSDTYLLVKVGGSWLVDANP